MPPEFIYFDMGNVVLHFSHERMAEQIGRVAGIEPKVAWRILFDDGVEWAYERGELTREQFYGRFCELAGVRADFEALDAAANDIFEINSPIVGPVGRLAIAGFRLGICSNTTESHWEYCRERYRTLKIAFPVQALSYRLKAMKPEASFYAGATEVAGVAAERIFFTDDRAENVEAARAAGWDAVQFESVSQLTEALWERGVRINY